MDHQAKDWILVLYGIPLSHCARCGLARPTWRTIIVDRDGEPGCEVRCLDRVQCLGPYAGDGMWTEDLEEIQEKEKIQEETRQRIAADHHHYGPGPGPARPGTFTAAEALERLMTRWRRA